LFYKALFTFTKKFEPVALDLFLSKTSHILKNPFTLKPAIQSKLPNIGTTIFTLMSSLAAEHQAINLGQGYPDFMMSEALIELVNAAMKKGHNQYTHMNGLALLRERLAEKIENLYAARINAETDITITPGGTYAIYTALTTVLQPGDEVIVFEPAYDSYIPNIEINGAVPVLIPLIYPDYIIDWNLVKQKISPKTKMIMLNTPHNPTGSILGRADIEQLRSIVRNTGLFILSDEVYEHLIFDNRQHESMLRYPDLLERSFVCFSFGKTYHCTGWKLGYCVAPPAMMKEFRKVHQFNCFSCHSPVQFALAEYLLQKDPYLELGRQLQKKRDYFQQLMQQTKFKALPSYGSYFQLYSYAGITDERDSDLATRLTKDYGVAAIPTSAFYTNSKDDKVLRFCFVKKEATLEEAVNRLIKL
jgi:methionine aminotransferase